MKSNKVALVGISITILNIALSYGGALAENKWEESPIQFNILKSDNNFKIKKLDEGEKLDPERWQKAVSGDGAALYIDRKTVEKNFYGSTSPEIKRPPVYYRFWLVAQLEMEDGTYISNPQQHQVSCYEREIDNSVISPGSVQERMYDFFCTSADAINTVHPSQVAVNNHVNNYTEWEQQQRIQDEIKQREQDEMRDRFTRKTHIYRGLNAVQYAIPLIRRF